LRDGRGGKKRRGAVSPLNITGGGGKDRRKVQHIVRGKGVLKWEAENKKKKENKGEDGSFHSPHLKREKKKGGGSKFYYRANEKGHFSVRGGKEKVPINFF